MREERAPLYGRFDLQLLIHPLRSWESALRELEADGMIDRERTGKPPAPVMCSLTGYVYSLVRNEEYP